VKEALTFLGKRFETKTRRIEVSSSEEARPSQSTHDKPDYHALVRSTKGIAKVQECLGHANVSTS
jgi:hypothetical protein